MYLLSGLIQQAVVVLASGGGLSWLAKVVREVAHSAETEQTVQRDNKNVLPILSIRMLHGPTNRTTCNAQHRVHSN